MQKIKINNNNKSINFYKPAWIFITFHIQFTAYKKINYINKSQYNYRPER